MKEREVSRAVSPASVAGQPTDRSTDGPTDRPMDQPTDPFSGIGEVFWTIHTTGYLFGGGFAGRGTQNTPDKDTPVEVPKT